jgi:hypothetical protein
MGCEGSASFLGREGRVKADWLGRRVMTGVLRIKIVGYLEISRLFAERLAGCFVE